MQNPSASKTTIGILGAGQLGMMLAQAGRKLEMGFRFLDPATEIAARGLGEHVCAAYEDIDALEEFSRGLAAITYEFENVPLESVRWLAQRVPLHPQPDALKEAQDRLFEKTFFRGVGIPVPEFSAFFFRDEYDDAVGKIGLPAVLKTRRFGYDGKGQRVIRTVAEANTAFKELNGMPLFLERFVPFDRELSIIAVRSLEGECRFYPLVENHHREGILRLSIAPAPGLTDQLQSEAEQHARCVMEKLNYVGVLAIEFFVRGGMLYANEMAPRVHNSGHWTIEGAETSQFENHLRAVTGMELGSTVAKGHSAMVNIIGDFQDWSEARNTSNVFVHDYGKKPRAGRKLGHVTLCGETAHAVEAMLDRLGIPQ
ncbi:5-(carboxyamino)imidazole ribonucleotide synthase [Candidatus Sumerlaeota bacterium]|nr:5-(carboxyamino)imidazole ribonucleotide synthase [Candidatus Sumerlaeota bacterium]